jgi:hypothetical protein
VCQDLLKKGGEELQEGEGSGTGQEGRIVPWQRPGEPREESVTAIWTSDQVSFLIKMLKFLYVFHDSGHDGESVKA